MFRKEKVLIKAIKQKSESLTSNKDEANYRVMNSVLNTLVLGLGVEPLRYLKYKSLNLK